MLLLLAPTSHSIVTRLSFKEDDVEGETRDAYDKLSLLWGSIGRAQGSRQVPGAKFRSCAYSWLSCIRMGRYGRPFITEAELRLTPWSRVDVFLRLDGTSRSY